MKRAILALLSTVSGLVFILSYRTVPPPTAVAESSPAPRELPPGVHVITGDTVQVDLGHGPLTVRVVVEDGHIVAASAIQNSTSVRSTQISGNALPQLNAEALTVLTDGFDTVSGATLTSAAYERSLQSALDQLT